MDEREKRKKILFTILGIIVLILLFFWIKSCSGGTTTKKTTKDITNIDLKTESLTLVVGESDKLPYTIIPSNTDETTKWISSDDSVVSVDTRGNIRALKVGNVIVSLVSESGVSDYTVVKVVSKETVDGKNITIGLIEDNVSIKVGTTKKLLFDIEPNDTPYNEVLWESSNNLVASVSSDGVVTGLRSGVTTITLKVILNDNSTVTDSATLTIEDNATLYLTSTINDIKEGEVIRAVVALSDASISIVDGNVKSSNERTALISNVTPETNYLTFDIKGVKKGNTSLKVSATTSEGKDLSLDIPIVVIGFDDLYISGGDKEIKIGEKFILSGRMEPSVSGSLDTICTSSSTKVATISFVDTFGEYNGSCQITGIKKGTSNISISIGGKKKTIKVTVVEDNSTDNPNPPDPTTGTDTPDTEVVTPTTLTSIEATLSKTEYKRNDAMGTLTVTAIYGDGSKKTLAATDYVMINDFDSSTLGSKTLNIAHTKDEVTKVTSVSYTVTGSGSDTGSTIAGSDGYSGGSSGGGGSSSSQGDTIKYTIGKLDFTDDTKPLANGSYKGNVGIEADVVGEFDPATHWLGIAVECRDGSSDCNPKSKDFVQATVFELSYKDGKIVGELPSTIDGKTTIYAGGSWLSLNDLKNDNLVNSNGVTTSLSDLKVITNNTYFNGGISNANYLSFRTEEGVGENNEITGDWGTLTLEATKEWYSKKEIASIRISATGKNGFLLQNLKIGDKPDSYTPPIYSVLTYGKVDTSKSKSLEVTATFVNKSSGQTNDITKTIELKIDESEPTCIATVSADKNSIKVEGSDSLPGSGIERIIGYTGEQAELISGNKFNKTYNFTVSKAGSYEFDIIDKAGNKNTCNATIEDYQCYQEMKCGSTNTTAKDCEPCERAGCEDSTNDSVHRSYECRSFDEPTIKLWIDGYGPDQNTNELSFPKTIKDYEYIGIYYYCELIEEETSICAKKGEQSSPEIKPFAKNCMFCGCKNWSKPTNWKRADGINTTAYSYADSISAFNTAKSTKKDCSDIIPESENGWVCGMGSTLGPTIPKECQ